jgi:hypothetical protein
MQNSSEALQYVEEGLGLPTGFLADSPLRSFSGLSISEIPERDQQIVMTVLVEELAEVRVRRDLSGGAVAVALLRARTRLLSDEFKLSVQARDFIKDHCLC